MFCGVRVLPQMDQNVHFLIDNIDLHDINSASWDLTRFTFEDRTLRRFADGQVLLCIGYRSDLMRHLRGHLSLTHEPPPPRLLSLSRCCLHKRRRDIVRMEMEDFAT